MIEETEDKTFRGDIKDGAKHCFVSFPGKFASAWDALIHEEAVHSESIACVFPCTPEDGLGKHEPDPLRPEICYCKTIYGNELQKSLAISRFCQEDSHQIKKKRRGKRLRRQTLWLFGKMPVRRRKKQLWRRLSRHGRRMAGLPPGL